MFTIKPLARKQTIRFTVKPMIRKQLTVTQDRASFINMVLANGRAKNYGEAIRQWDVKVRRDARSN